MDVMAEIRKFITALVGAVTLSLTLAPDGFTSQEKLAVVVSFLTAVGVYTIPNKEGN